MSDKRIEINFKRRLCEDSENGITFSFLKEQFGEATQDAIVNVVRLIYLPSALAESGAAREEVEEAINKSLDFVREKTSAALGACSKNSSKSNHRASSNGFAKETESALAPMLAPFQQPWNPSTSDDSELYELDENKLYEN